MKRHLHPLFHEAAAAPGPPLHDALVRQAEARLGLRLPVAYVRALQEANGGGLRRSRLKTAQGILDLRDLIGIGYEDGLDGPEGSRALQEEWGYPADALVLSFEGRCALLLDYRACGTTGGEPAVVWLDTDTEERLILGVSVEAFLAALEYPVAIPQIALLPSEVPDLEAALALCRALGARGEVRLDWTGTHSLSADGRIVRLRPNRYRGVSIVPELAEVQWVLEIESAQGVGDPLVQALQGHLAQALWLAP